MNNAGKETQAPETHKLMRLCCLLVLVLVQIASGCVPRASKGEQLRSALPCFDEPRDEHYEHWKAEQRVVCKTRLTGQVLASGRRIAAVSKNAVLLVAHVTPDAESLDWEPVFTATKGNIYLESIAAKADALLLREVVNLKTSYYIAQAPRFQLEEVPTGEGMVTDAPAAISPDGNEIVIYGGIPGEQQLVIITRDGKVRGVLSVPGGADRTAMLPAEYRLSGAEDKAS